MPLLKPSSALLSSAPKTSRPSRATHSTTSHLHECRKIYLTRVHPTARHLLHHHLHLPLVHSTRRHAAHPIHGTRALRRTRRRTTTRHRRHPRHAARHHLLHLRHLSLLLLNRLAHLLLLQPVCLPRELVEAVVEVVRVVFARAPPEFVLLGEIGV